MQEISEIELEFYKSAQIHANMKPAIEDLLKELLPADQYNIHHIGGRVKDMESFRGKINSDPKYQSLSDVTDVIGMRIITYLNSDVDKVATCIANEFDLDEDNCIDKRDVDPNVFGYNSLHYVVQLNQQRWQSPKYKEFAGIKFEIQIRSIFQHSWAEIEHDLGYKSEIEIPGPLKRSIYRLSALLEIADMEFDRVKREAAIYEQQVKEDLNRDAFQVPINRITLKQFVDTDETCKVIMDWISTHQIIPIDKNEPDDITLLLHKLEFLKIDTIGVLKQQMNFFQSKLLTFTILLFKRRKSFPTIMNSFTPIFYFIHYTAAGGGREYLEEYKNYRNTDHSGEIVEVVDFIELYNNAQQSTT